MDRKPRYHDVLQGTVLLIHGSVLHCLKSVHPVDYLPDDCVHIVQLRLLLIDDIELALVCIRLLLCHRKHSAAIELGLKPAPSTTCRLGWNSSSTGFPEMLSPPFPVPSFHLLPKPLTRWIASLDDEPLHVSTIMNRKKGGNLWNLVLS